MVGCSFMARCSATGCTNKARRRGLCAVHYAEAPRVYTPTGEAGRLSPVRLPLDEMRAIELAAEARGITVMAWQREAYRAALKRQAKDDPEIRAALARKPGA